MFSFMDMASNYESRKVGNDQFDWGFISTTEVNDGRQPYETAVEHFQYNDGKMVIVEAYDSKKEAAKGHKKWIEIMNNKKLPKELVDCCNCEIAQLASSLGSEMTFKRNTKIVKEK